MPQFCRNATVSIVMCDVTRPKTLQATRIWKKRVDEIVLQPNGQPIPAVLLINKVRCTYTEILHLVLIVEVPIVTLFNPPSQFSMLVIQVSYVLCVCMLCMGGGVGVVYVTGLDSFLPFFTLSICYLLVC